MFWKIKEKIWDLKMRKERAKKGYCKEDIWNINDWFLNIIPRILKDFNESRNGYPCNLSDEEWDNIIKRMIFCFEEANEDTCSQTNEIEFEIEDYEKWLKREAEIDKYRNDMKNEGLELFSKYFWNLWD